MNEMGISDIKQQFDRLLAVLRTALYHGSDKLSRALAYALEGEGKRVRPLLAVLCNRAAGGDGRAAFQAAFALEMVHTYSLIHDDLPCMDNDGLRRGRATLHIAFDEATALLAGDALLTDAFRVLASSSLTTIAPEFAGWPAVDPERRIGMIEGLASAAGGAGMVFGQALDMHFTRHATPAREDLDRIHTNKTGRLIACACQLGAMSAPESRIDQWERCRAFGQKIGLVFQITDDLLDGAAAMGKSSGKDSDQGKLTYLKLMSVDAARAEAARLTDEAMALVAPLGAAASPLCTFARTLLHRNH